MATIGQTIGHSERLQTYTERLLSLQLANGSWPYRADGETGLAETTCYAMLALRAAGVPNPRQTDSLDWLQSLQRKNGGFAPQAGVEISNWSTSLVLLAFLHCGREDATRPAIDWLLGLEGNETGWLTKATRKVLNIPPPYPQNHAGWPWVAGTVSWLIPTALATLALQHALAKRADPKISFRVQEGISMLKERRCQDGGWNHGATIALDVPAPSYPETTGIALLGLQAVPGADLPGANELAVSMLGGTHIATIVSWLQLALQARSVVFPMGEEEAIQCRNTLDFALRTLALSAIAGNNIFRV
ncbi:MAG: terpene cyclase/mutase family protein [Bryobacterales bacterium]|nr:terpene cyclase/mutase family protein [Bryobacterales bacterium]